MSDFYKDSYKIRKYETFFPCPSVMLGIKNVTEIITGDLEAKTIT